MLKVEDKEMEVNVTKC